MGLYVNLAGMDQDLESMAADRAQCRAHACTIGVLTTCCDDNADDNRLLMQTLPFEIFLDFMPSSF